MNELECVIQKWNEKWREYIKPHRVKWLAELPDECVDFLCRSKIVASFEGGSESVRNGEVYLFQSEKKTYTLRLANSFPVGGKSSKVALVDGESVNRRFHLTQDIEHILLAFPFDKLNKEYIKAQFNQKLENAKRSLIGKRVEDIIQENDELFLVIETGEKLNISKEFKKGIVKEY